MKIKHFFVQSPKSTFNVNIAPVISRMMMTQEPDINNQYQLRMMAQAVTELAERIDQGFDRTAQNIEQGFERTNQNIEQGFERNSRNLDSLRELVETGFDDLKRVSQQQADTARSLAESVSRLVILLERKS
ncbi:hypothetical protein [Phormidesmis sp. 146-33]